MFGGKVTLLFVEIFVLIHFSCCCWTDPASSNEYISIMPNVIQQIGGESVVITGPCFDPKNDRVKLVVEQLKTTTDECTVVSELACICPVRYMDTVGKLDVKLVINEKNVYKGYLVSRASVRAESLGGLYTYYVYDDFVKQTVTLKWNSSAFFDDIDLSGTYSLNYVWINDTTYETNVVRLRELTESEFKSNNLELNLSNIDVKFYDIFGVRASKSFLAIADSEQLALNTEQTLEVIKWLKLTTLVVLDKIENATSKCIKWHDQDISSASPYMDNLPACWPRVPLDEQGQFVDHFGDFVIDGSCNPFDNNSTCWYHPGSKGCYRSIKTYNGTGQQCCYKDTGILYVGPPGGGTFDLGHSIYQSLDHFYFDVVSYFLCCIVSENCQYYYDIRPSESTRWKASKQSGVTGDPHFISLDGTQFTFNGYGEYTLLEVVDSNRVIQTIQIRSLPLKKNAGGTVVKAIVIGSETSDRIQIELDEESFESFVYFNDALVDFDRLKLSYVTVNGGNIFKANNYSYLVQMENEINIEIKINENYQALLALVDVPIKFMKQTRGLLGLMDNNSTNDFLLPDGTILSYLDATDDREVYEKFAKYWKINESMSLFYYRPGQSYSTFVNDAYLPSFLNATSSIEFDTIELEAEAEQLCQSNRRCLFDVAITKLVDIGRLTIDMDQMIEYRSNNIKSNKETCVPLSILFENGSIKRNVSASGNLIIYTFACDTNYCLSEKSNHLKCENGVYDGNMPKCEQCNHSLSIHKFTLSYILVFLYLTVFASTHISF